MITWNNWFINMGASEFQVDDGDIIKWQYTCQLGNDIGNSMDNPSAEITGINFASNYGTLSPAFNIEYRYNYTYTIPSNCKKYPFGGDAGQLLGPADLYVGRKDL